jgi:hypothetical protein
MQQTVTVHIKQLVMESELKYINYLIAYCYVCANKLSIIIQEITKISFKFLKKQAITVHKKLAMESEIKYIKHLIVYWYV